MKRGEAAITGIFPGKLEGAKCYLCARLHKGDRVAKEESNG